MIRSATDGEFARAAPLWLRRLGVRSWLLLGAIGLVAVVLSLMSTLSGIVVPLVLATVVGVLLRPVVDAAARRRVPRTVAAALALVLILASALLLGVVVVRGLLAQAPEIAAVAAKALGTLEAWLAEGELDPGLADAVGSAVSTLLPTLGQGIVSALGGFVSGAASFFIGVFFGVFTLFFVLRDGHKLNVWLAGHLGVEPELGSAIVDDGERAVRGYFMGTAITAAVTAPIVGVPMILLGLPLVVPVMIVYFFSSFVPYLGAWVGGAFAVIVALGAGGVEAAAVILVVVVVSNGSIQSTVNAWAVGGRLKLHPVVVLVTTAGAGMVGGITLMILATPLVATAIMTLKRLGEAGVFEEEAATGVGGSD